MTMLTHPDLISFTIGARYAEITEALLIRTERLLTSKPDDGGVQIPAQTDPQPVME
jgi:hypothetical protein